MIYLKSDLFMRKILLCSVLLLCGSGVCCSLLAADDPDKQYRDSVYRRVFEDGVLSLSCHFSYAQNSSEINPSMGRNQYELDKLNEFIRVALSDSSLYVKRIALGGYSSIEGAYAVNERLARNRVQSFKGFLEKEYYLSELVPIDVSWVAEDWGTLYNLVLDSRIQGREEVLKLIETVDIFRGREAQLMRIQGGKTYKQLLNECFPLLRRVEIRVEYDLQRMLQDTYKKELNEEEFEKALNDERAKLREEIYWEVREELPRIDTTVTYTGGKVEILGLGEIHSITHTEDNPLCHLCYPKWGVKTNLMHLAGFAQGIEYTTPLLNLSVEHFFTRHFSLEAGVEYSNWKYDDGKEFQGLTGYRIEPRFWLPHTKSFSCVYVGAYGQVGDFNLRTLKMDSNEDTYKLTGDYIEAGLSAGVYIPLSLHWGFDIGVRGGYRHSKGKAYEYGDDGKYQVYDRTSNRLRLNAVILALTYRWGHK